MVLITAFVTTNVARVHNAQEIWRSPRPCDVARGTRLFLQHNFDRLSVQRVRASATPSTGSVIVPTIVKLARALQPDLTRQRPSREVTRIHGGGTAQGMRELRKIDPRAVDESIALGGINNSVEGLYKILYKSR